MLRLSLFLFVSLVLLSTANKSFCIVEAVSDGREEISSECLSCHEDIDDPNGSSHSVSHVIGIVYADHAASDESLRPVTELPRELVLSEGVVTCMTCHGSEPHDGQALVINNRESQLCSACHLK